MKNSVKVALGIVTGGVLIYLNQKRKQKSKALLYTAPDGNQYKEDQMYRTAEGDVYKNGKKVHFELPSDSVQNKSRVDSNFNNQHLNENVNLNHEVSYHQRGQRHQ